MRKPFVTEEKLLVDQVLYDWDSVPMIFIGLAADKKFLFQFTSYDDAHYYLSCEVFDYQIEKLINNQISLWGILNKDRLLLVKIDFDKEIISPVRDVYPEEFQKYIPAKGVGLSVDRVPDY